MDACYILSEVLSTKLQTCCKRMEILCIFLLSFYMYLLFILCGRFLGKVLFFFFFFFFYFNGIGFLVLFTDFSCKGFMCCNVD
jgi:hypothetical protein